MEINLNVEGMVCSGCENRVQNSLKTIDGVTDVIASHTNKKVTVKTSKVIDEKVLKEAIEDLGFEVR